MKKYALGTMVRVGAWSTLFGGVVGLSLGMLLAPEAGRKTRLRLIYQLERLGLRVSDFADSLLAPGVESDARRTGNALVQDARTEARRIREEIDALLSEMRHQDSGG